MSSERRATRRRMRRALPWVTWGVAAAVTLWLASGISAFGVSPGEAEPQLVVLASPRASSVLEVSVKAGQEVEAGAVLARLDTTELELDLAVARAELERARLEVGAEAGTQRERDLVNRERLEGDAEKAALEVARLEAEAREDRAELKQVDEQMARQNKLVQDGLASARSLDELKLRRASLSKAVESAESLVRSARTHAAASRKRAQEWAAAGGEARAVAPRVAAVRAQTDRVQKLSAAIERMTLRAPVPGRVLDVHLGQGSTALAGAPVVTLSAAGAPRVVAWVEERSASSVRGGDRAQLVASDRSEPPREGRVEGLGSGIVELPPRFRRVPTEPEFARKVYVVLADGAAHPLPGQAFDVTFRRERR